MKHALTPNSASVPVSSRVSPTGDLGDADTPPRPSRGRTATCTTPPAVEAPMPGQTELPLAYRQVTLWSL